MKKTKPLWLKLLLSLVLLGVLACVWEFVSSQNPYILPVRRALKYDVLGMTTADEKRETAGLDAYTLQVSLYENGERADGAPSPDTDCKRVYEDGTFTRLVNYTHGYQMDFPAGTQFDFSLSPLYVYGYGDGFDVTISREKADYQSIKDVVTFELSTFLPWFFDDHTVEDYIRHYEYRFLLDEGWQKENDVVVNERTLDGGAHAITAAVHGLDETQYERYVFLTIPTASREYLRIMFRTHNEVGPVPDDPDSMEFMLNNHVWVFDPMGTAVYDTDYAPDLSRVVWSDETQALYEKLSDFSAPMDWGIFLQDFYVGGFTGELTAMEEKLDYTFPVILYYRHFPTHEFPTDVMQENYEAGRLVELTLQLTDNNNTDMFAKSPLLEIYRGSMDDQLRQWARDAAAFEHPFFSAANAKALRGL